MLQSAEVMKKAVRNSEQFIEKAEGYTKGRVVLATVYGDVHDIGKIARQHDSLQQRLYRASTSASRCR